MRNPLARLFSRKQERKQTATAMAEFTRAAQEFSLKYPHALLIFGDPQSDAIVMTCEGIIAPVHVLNRDGSRCYIVANALKHNRGDQDVDRFLLAVDGGVYAIAKSLYDMRRRSIAGKVLDFVNKEPAPGESAVTLTDGSTLAPVQFIDR